MENSYHRLDAPAFARLIGVPEEPFVRRHGVAVSGAHLTYRMLATDERKNLAQDIEDRITRQEFTVAGAAGKTRWVAGWSENLRQFAAEGYDPSALRPRYIRAGQPIRIHQDYAMPEHPDFEWQFGNIYRTWLFETYFKNTPTLYEFGSGSGINLAVAAELFPEKRFFGLDWVEPAVDIVNMLGKKLGVPMHGVLFDMFRPNDAIRIEEGSGILLFSALEQLGLDFAPFIEYLIRQKPSIVVCVDTYYEMYDPANEADALARTFMEQRNYLRECIPYLKQQQERGNITITELRRIPFGSLYVEGYSLAVWRPT